MSQPGGPGQIRAARAGGARRLRCVAGVAALAVAVGACGAGAAPAACPAAGSEACPSPAPRYADDVAPAVQRLCRPCHTAGGVEATAPFDTVQQVRARRAEIQMRLQSCLMPPSDQPQPTPVEREALLGWLACGAPDDTAAR